MAMALCGAALGRAAAAEVETPPVKFVYRKASPAVRWPHRKQHFRPEEGNADAAREPIRNPESSRSSFSSPATPAFKLKPMPLKKAERVERLSDAICRLEEHQFVSDTLEGWTELLASSDYCCVLKRVAARSWQRALEVFEYVNIKRWYTPDPRMLAGMLSLLGKANQAEIARELFDRAEPSMSDCLQVYNAMMSVYARLGDGDRVQELLCRMRAKGCQPDLVTFNTVIKARTRGGIQDGLASSLLEDVYTAGLEPDTITYNTIISACSFNHRLANAIQVFEEMQRRNQEMDAWTFNAMISVYGRAGKVEAAGTVFRRMQHHGLRPDAVTFNSLLFAYAKDGKVEEVDRIRKLMEAAGYAAHEVTYNTMIHMYGKLGLHQKAEWLYLQMLDEGRFPDAVTFTVLIDSLGKAGLVDQAVTMFEDMLRFQVQPTLQAFSAMICAYAKAGLYGKAEKTFNLMIRCGVQPDVLAYSVMLDVFFRAGEHEKCIGTYRAMVEAGLKPKTSILCILVRVYFARGMLSEIQQLQTEADFAALSSELARGGYLEEAALVLKVALEQELAVKQETVFLVLSSLEASGNYEEARSLGAAARTVLHSNAGAELCRRLAVMLARAGRFAEAEEELSACAEAATASAATADVYKALLRAYEQAGKYDEVSTKFLEMVLLGLELDADVFKSAVIAFCKKSAPQTGLELLEDCLYRFGSIDNPEIQASLIESYGMLKQCDNAELVFWKLEEAGCSRTLEVYEAMVLAYAASGRYERVQEMLEEMATVGMRPTVVWSNSLLKLFADTPGARGILDLYHQLSRRLQVVPALETFTIILSALSKHNNLSAARTIYEDMKWTGFIPSVAVFKDLLVLYCREGSPEEAEKLLKDMKAADYEPDVGVYNIMISMYSQRGSYEQAVAVFKGMQELGCEPDACTYNTLIVCYCRNDMIQEANGLLQEMSKQGKTPLVASYTSLISSYSRLCDFHEAEAVFNSMLEVGCKPDFAAYNVMINVYRKAGNFQKIEEAIQLMKKDGHEPSSTTIHMLMDSYGKGGQVGKAAKVLEQLPEMGICPDAMHYTSLIDAQLKNREYLAATALLKQMHEEGVRPTYVTMSCFIGAASLCERTSHALLLLKALAEVGFSLPLRLLTEKGQKVLEDTHDIFDQLEEAGPEASQGVVNVIIDMLWAFRQCATASHVFSAAIEKCIYPRLIARIREKSWGADFRNLSPGASLVALVLWLDQMQDASLEGVPEPPKIIQIRTGCNLLNNQASVIKTIKQHLYQMGSPFLPSRSRQGILGAKGYSVCRWLKDSPYCLDLELKDTETLPEVSSVRVHNGAFMWSGLVEATEEIEDNMGTDILPKKFSRLVHRTPKSRAASIKADLKGRAEKLAKQLKVKLSKRSVEEEERRRYHRLRKSGKIKQQPKGKVIPRGYEHAGLEEPARA